MSKAIERQLAETNAEGVSITAEYERLHDFMERLKSTQGTAKRRIWEAEFNRFSKGVDRIESRFQKLRRRLESIKNRITTSEVTDLQASEYVDTITALIDGIHAVRATPKDKL